MSRITPKVPFEASHPDALAVYCSDGRFTQSVEALLAELGYPRLDTLTIPGGPALLEHTSATLAGVETSRTAVQFLITGHHIAHVVLVAHESCGYYKARLPYDSVESMLRRQIADLRAAERWIRGDNPKVDVMKFYAWRTPTAVEFEPIE